MEILKDLATVVTTYNEKMIVEGHTGRIEPKDYWQELADNRSKLIVKTLVKKENVDPDLLIPKGMPGGGAKVVLYPPLATAG